MAKVSTFEIRKRIWAYIIGQQAYTKVISSSADISGAENEVLTYGKMTNRDFGWGVKLGRP
jgi:hypothetical protein